MIGDLGFDDSDRSPSRNSAIATSRSRGCEIYDGVECTECIQLPNSYKLMLNGG